MSEAFRIAHDSLGDVYVPAKAYWGPQTQRAKENFPISGLHLPRRFIRAQGIIKAAAAKANAALGLLDARKAEAIQQAAKEVIEGKWDDQFVVDLYQAGAGTSQNMNANEVIANRAAELLGGTVGDTSLVHPNDHVNMAQSTNDTIHVAIHIAGLEAIVHDLLPALENLSSAFSQKAEEFDGIVKAGRTHLQDAVPVRLGQEFSGYAHIVHHLREQLEITSHVLQEIGMGGTATGTGLNAHPRFRALAIEAINEQTGLHFREPENMFAFMQNLDAVVEVSGEIRAVATALTKIANDLRLLSSGPYTGFGEINLPAVQPGSSIMPGKVNPVMAEMLNMVCFQVIGCDQTVMMAGQAGQLELNVMMPVVAGNLLHEINILANACNVVADRCIRGITADAERCHWYAEHTLALATHLNPIIGYDKAAEIAKEAQRTGKAVREVALERGVLSKEELDKVFDYYAMTEGGID